MGNGHGKPGRRSRGSRTAPINDPGGINEKIRNRFTQQISQLKEEGVLEARPSQPVIKFPREIARGAVKVLQEVGEGAFGKVCKAVLDESGTIGIPGYTVAIKTTHADNEDGLAELCQEAAIMVQVEAHPNVVALIGMVLEGAVSDPLMLIMSFCEHGNLKDWLVKAKAYECVSVGAGDRQKRSVSMSQALPGPDLSFEVRLQMMLDTAEGMNHLMKNKIIHRDLAARNVLLDAAFACRVADFGLARQTKSASSSEDGDYYRTDNGVMPLRWTAPESLQTRKFTSQSDVWSYGILCVEIWTDGNRPYPSLSNVQLLQRLRDGGVHPRPAKCPPTLFQKVIQPCFRAHPAARATFSHLVATIGPILQMHKLGATQSFSETRRAFSTDDDEIGQPPYEAAQDAAAQDEAARTRRLEYEYHTSKPNGATATDDPVLQREISGLKRWLLEGEGSKGSVYGGFDGTGVSIAASGSNNPNTIQAIKIAIKQLLTKLNGRSPSLVLVSYTCTHDVTVIGEVLATLLPGIPVSGMSTCRGVVVNAQWVSYQKEFGLGLWALSDASGQVKQIHIDDMQADGFSLIFRAHLKKVKAAAATPPSFLMIMGSPGGEEGMLDDITTIFGESVPVVGGSAADNAVKGEWSQLSVFPTKTPKVSTQGLCIVACWTTCTVTTTLSSGFALSEHSGIVTKMSDDDTGSGRTIAEIDGEPAGAVYDRWSGGMIMGEAEFDDTGQANLLAASSFCPLGEIENSQRGFFRVLHPAFLDKRSASLTCFASAWIGMPIGMLSASASKIVRTITSSAKVLCEQAEAHQAEADGLHGDEEGDGFASELKMPESPSATSSLAPMRCIGALMIFCGGLVMAIDDEMPLAAEELNTMVNFRDTMGFTCFGEQGMNNSTHKKCHGNLMFGCLIFS